MSSVVVLVILAVGHAFDPAADTFVLNPISGEHCKAVVTAYGPGQLGGTKKPSAISIKETENVWVCTPDAVVTTRIRCTSQADGKTWFELNLVEHRSLHPRGGFTYQSQLGAETLFLFPDQETPSYLLLNRIWRAGSQSGDGAELFALMKMCSGVAFASKRASPRGRGHAPAPRR